MYTSELKIATRRMENGKYSRESNYWQQLKSFKLHQRTSHAHNAHTHFNNRENAFSRFLKPRNGFHS